MDFSTTTRAVILLNNRSSKVGLAYFGWEDELSQIIGRKADLCSRLNKYIEDDVRREAVTVYEQA